MDTKIIARAWVLGFGYDCDRTENISIYCFDNIDEAKNCAESMSINGDGEYYEATESFKKAKEYAKHNDIKMDIEYV